MSNWDLMMPGMGLTAIGIAGLTISYAEIAHTFIDGMHALTGLTMFVGLIFLAAGILDGGVSTSNRAKATTLVILSIGLGFGMFAMTMNTSNFTITLAGILMGIAFPAIIIAYLAAKQPRYLKPVGSIVAMAAATGIIMWLTFGFVGPDTYMVPQQAAVDGAGAEGAGQPTGPFFEIRILEGSGVVGEGEVPDFDPDDAVVPQGHAIRWTNEDPVVHTVASTVGFGELFSSEIISKDGTYTLDTAGMEAGKYEYLCTLHTWMTGTFVIGEAGQAQEGEAQAAGDAG